MRLPKGEDLPAVIVNLSVGGIKFSCSRDTAHHILPEDQRIPGQVTGVVIEILFDLQTPLQDRQPFDATARVVHSERLAQDVFHVGIQFHEVDESEMTALKGYIESNRVRQYG